MTRFTIVVFIAFIIAAAVPAQADDYVAPTWPDLLHTLVRFKALDLDDNDLIDEYAQVTDCELYKTFYEDDFKWNKVRQAIRNSAQMNIKSYPSSFGYEIPLDLDRYDFNQKIYSFTEVTTIQNINTFALFEYHMPPCKNNAIVYLPKTYRAVMDTPLTMTGMPITQKDGEALLQHMYDTHNDTRRIYARFNLKVLYIEPWRRRAEASDQKGVQQYAQSNYSAPQSLRMDVRLESIDFFEDPEMTRLIHESKL